jgi:hypothetical protein
VEERRTRDVLASAGHMLQRSHATVGWAATELLERQRRLAAAESEAATRAHGFGAKADMANLGLVAAQVRGGSRGNTNMPLHGRWGRKLRVSDICPQMDLFIIQ